MACFLTSIRCSVRSAALSLTALGAVSCLVSPPLGLEDPLENHPPFLDEAIVSPPATTIVASSEGSVLLQADVLYDQDDEDELYYAWYSGTLGTITTGTLRRRPTEGGALVYGIFYAFEGTTYNFQPCQAALRGRQSETLWLYVTDRQWESTDSSGVELARDQGALLTSWSWVIDLGDVVCGGA